MVSGFAVSYSYFLLCMDLFFKLQNDRNVLIISVIFFLLIKLIVFNTLFGSIDSDEMLFHEIYSNKPLYLIINLIIEFY